jgi:hypothetical protein
MKNLILIVAVLAACGGKKPDTTPQPPPDDTTSAPPPSNDGMVDPQKMDEIKIDLDRKRGIISHCLAIAVDNRELPKSTHGKITLEFTISTAGHADDIKVIKADFESKSVTDCVIKHVGDIQFPELNKPVPWSYAYAFEAN